MVPSDRAGRRSDTRQRRQPRRVRSATVSRAHRGGPGLLELNVAARQGVRAADDAALLKLAVKEIAASLGAVAGILDHLAGASLCLNPTINSYKRLVPGYFAPVNVSWGVENRSGAVRVIRSDRPELCRIECRRPGADARRGRTL